MLGTEFCAFSVHVVNSKLRAPWTWLQHGPADPGSEREHDALYPRKYAVKLISFADAFLGCETELDWLRERPWSQRHATSLTAPGAGCTLLNTVQVQQSSMVTKTQAVKAVLGPVPCRPGAEVPAFHREVHVPDVVPPDLL